MPFDLETAIAVREREDGLLEKDTFDLSTAVPVEDAILLNEPVIPKSNVEPNWMLSVLDTAKKETIALFANPNEQVYTGRTTLKDEKQLRLSSLEQQKSAQPAANRPGYFEVPETQPRWASAVEQAVNLAMVAYVGVTGFKFAKNELAIRAVARNVSREANALADKSIKVMRPEELKAVQSSYEATYDTAILNGREALVKKYEDVLLQKLSAYEMVGGKVHTVAEGEMSKTNIFKLLKSELSYLNKSLGEAGQANIIRPKVGDIVSFKKGEEVLTGAIEAIVGNRATINLGKGAEAVIATLNQLSVPEVKPTEGKVYYHGTPTGELNFTEQPKGNQVPFGVHFTADKAIAEDFASGMTKGRPTGNKGKVIETKLSIKNPLDISKGVYKEGTPEYKILKEIADKSGLSNVERNFRKDIGFLAQPMEGSVKAINPDEVMGGAKLNIVKEVLKNNGYDLAIKYSMKGSKDPLGGGTPVYTDAIAILDKSLLSTPTGEGQIAEEEIQRVASNILKNNTGITKKDAEAMAKDVIENRKFAKGEGQKPPIEPPKTAVSGEPAPEKPIGEMKAREILKDIAIENADEEEKLLSGAIKQFFRYEDEITKLEEELKVSDFNTEAEKVKAQYKLKKLKEEYAQARENQRQKKALRDEVKGLIKDIQSAPKEDIAIEYQEMIDKLKSKFDLKRRQEKTIAKRESMKAFVERMKIEGKPIEIPADKLAMLDKVNLEDMTLDQLREVKQTIDDMERLGKTKLKARTAVYEAKKETAKIALIEEATPINSKQLPEVPIGDKVNSWVERVVALQNYAQKTTVGLTPIDGLADVTGMTSMKKVLDKDYSGYLTYNDNPIKQWFELTKNFTDKEFNRIGVKAAANQRGGMERLANSNKTESEVNAIKLTSVEEKAYGFVLDNFQRLYPLVKRYMKEVYNVDVGEVDNYVSFMSDYDLMSDLEIYQRFGQTPEQVVTRKTKTVEQGFTKERAAISKIKLETNIDKIFRRHLDDVAYMLNTGKNIKMYFEIINSPEMREKLGDVGTLAWLQWLDLMARKGGTEGAKRIAALDILRQNIGAGVLAFRLSSALVQFSSFADTIATIGAEWATKGASSIATSKEWRNFIMDNFPEIKKAVGDDIAFREFGEGFLANLTRAGLMPLQVLDGLMRSTAACGSYQKLAAQKGIAIDLKNPDPELIAEATRLMRQSQGSSFFKDQPLAITAGYGLTDNKSLNKTILTFQSFMLNRWDNINRQIYRMGIKEKDYGKAISSVFWLLIFAGAVEEGIRRGSRKIIGTLAKDKRKEQDFIANSLLNIIQTMPLAGQLVSSITYSSNPVPVIKTIEDLLGGLGSAIKGKATETKLRGAIRAIGASGSLAGVPGSSQTAQIIRSRVPKAGKKTYW